MMFDMNSKGVSIQIIRDKEGKIRGVSYMTEEEVAELIGEPFGNQEEIPSAKYNKQSCFERILGKNYQTGKAKANMENVSGILRE